MQNAAVASDKTRRLFVQPASLLGKKLVLNVVICITSNIITLRYGSLLCVYW
jgi:hypothetical protein